MFGETSVTVSASIAPLNSHWKPKGTKDDKKEYKEELTYNGGLSTQIWRPKETGTHVEITNERMMVKKYSDPYLNAPLNPKLVNHWKREVADSSDVTTTSTDNTTCSGCTVESCSCHTITSSDSSYPAISVDHLFENKKKNEVEKMAENSENEKSIDMDSPDEKAVKSKLEDAKKILNETPKTGDSINMNSSSEIISISSFDSSSDAEKTRLELEKLVKKSKNLKKKMAEIVRKKAVVKDIIVSSCSSSDVSFLPMKKAKKNSPKRENKEENLKNEDKLTILSKPVISVIFDAKEQPATAVKSSSYVSIEAVQINEWTEVKYWLLLVFFMLFVYFYRIHVLQQNCC